MTYDIRLRDVEPGDLPVFFEHQRDPISSRMAGVPARNREAFDAHWAKILADASLDKQAILCDGKVAGSIVSFDRAGLREVGYWIGREFWGRGIATRALRQFLLLVTRRPLYGRVARHNIGSLRVLEKCGFTMCEEGVIPPLLGEESAEEHVLCLT